MIRCCLKGPKANSPAEESHRDNILEYGPTETWAQLVDMAEELQVMLPHLF